MSKTIYKLLFLLLALPFITACSDDEETETAGNVQVEISNVVGNAPLELGTTTYTNPAGDSYSVTNFKYYISNVRLVGNNGQVTYVEPESYHLIAQDGKTSFMLDEIPVGIYDKVELSIGIDEKHNHSTDQEGDLDPSNEMVWDWDTGYKFLTLVGSYTGNAESGALVFHVGGDTNYKTILLDLPQAINLHEKFSYKLTMQADVNELFQSPNLIDFDVMNSGGHGAGPSMLAENYGSEFLKVTGVN
ncbi:MbnP family protein [Pontibacter silvestris]|uniref:MbnP family protein n=1 Tax=Pontibacter silvestris TaxID=2305183 RepID=A0ABW4X2J3_9BACT|nr:MbnP family protein [Pontibacter silvestris]MCC9138313.1 hypothetical protein [Pontibacter silvestris]